MTIDYASLKQRLPTSPAFWESLRIEDPDEYADAIHEAIALIPSMLEEIGRLQELIDTECRRAEDEHGAALRCALELEKARAEVERLTAPVPGEIARLAEQLRHIDGTLLDRQEAAAALQRLAQEVERQKQERDQFMEQAAQRDRHDTDMQEIMRINNELVAERDNYKADYLRRHKDACDRWERIRDLEADLKQHQELNAAGHKFLLQATAENDCLRSLNTEMREALKCAELNAPFWQAVVREILDKTEPKDQSNAS